MKPLYERVLIRPRAKETTLQSGIMLPEKAVKRPNIGTVIAVGDGTPHQPMLVKVGDIVLCNRFAGADLTFKGEKCQMVLSNEIIAVLDDINDIDLEEYD
jgi:chaperonin GroES